MNAAPTAEPAVPARWAASLWALALVLGLLLLAYRDTVAGMVTIWSRSDTFAHGFLVAPISLWLIWRQRRELAMLTPRAQPWMLVPMVLAALLWLAGELVVVNAARQFALVAMLVLAVPAVLGLAVAHRMLFPLLFLFFAVPFGEFLLPAMMEGTADFVVRALRFTGVPVYREGLFFIIPSGHWSVVEECSGVRYLIASFMVGTLFAHLNYRSARRRAIFMGVSLVVPVVANWLRAYLIVMLGHLSGNKLAVGVDHLIYGWVFFGVVILVMFMIGARWAEDTVRPASGGSAAQPGVVIAPAQASAWAVAALVIGIGLAPQGAIWRIAQAEPGGSSVQLPPLPEPAPGWELAPAPSAGWEPGFVNPSGAALAGYGGPRGMVGVRVAYFRGQSDERKLVTSSHRLVAREAQGWSSGARGVATIPVGGQEAEFARSEILGPEGLPSGVRTHLVIWKAYWVDGRFVVGDARAKLAQAWARLRGLGDDGAIVVFFADAAPATDGESALKAFVTDHLAAVDRMLQHARTSGRSR